jgi:hypothetical protein
VAPTARLLSPRQPPLTALGAHAERSFETSPAATPALCAHAKELERQDKQFKQ